MHDARLLLRDDTDGDDDDKMALIPNDSVIDDVTQTGRDVIVTADDRNLSVIITVCCFATFSVADSRAVMMSVSVALNTST